MTQRVRIPTRTGHLSALYDEPESGSPRAGVLLCHSWPGLGGSVKEPVLRAVSARLIDAGCMVLRIKFRSVARDAHVWQRLWPSAQADIRVGQRFLTEHMANDGEDIPLLGVGYSYGAAQLVASANQTTAYRAVALIGPPFRYPRSRARMRSGPPTLIVTGEDDIYCPPRTVEQIRRRRPDVVTTYIVSGSDHFLKGREQEVADVVTEFLMAQRGNAMAAKGDTGYAPAVAEAS